MQTSGLSVSCVCGCPLVCVQKEQMGEWKFLAHLFARACLLGVRLLCLPTRGTCFAQKGAQKWPQLPRIGAGQTRKPKQEINPTRVELAVR